MDLETVQKWLKDSVGRRNKWRSEAKKAYDFVAGEQWSPEERQVMEDLMRPVTVFNRIAPIVDAIVGHETANRQAVAYMPRQLGATQAAETIGAAAKWVRDECGADGEESDAFFDAVVTGEGWTGTTITYDIDPDGQICIERIDPREMDPDVAATKKNYADAKYLHRTRRMDRDRAQELWPEADFSDLEPSKRQNQTGDPIDVISAAFYHLDSGAQGRSGVEENYVLVHETQWWEMEGIYRVDARTLPPQIMQALSMIPALKDVKPSETGMLTFSETQWKALEPSLPGVKPLKQKRRAYKRMFWSGEQVLEEGDTPTKDSFTYKAVTAKRDHQKHLWYGIVRCMRDPQLWSNKFMSMSLEALGAGAKGGIFAEIDAFNDPRKAEDDYADPTKIVYLKVGAIAAKKIMPRPITPLPPNANELMMYANQSLNDAAGVNQAVMGFSKELDVSGVLEQTRLQAGLNLLSYLFDALRRYRKEQGTLLMGMIREYIPQGRLIKIEGQEGAKYVPLIFDPNVMKYDIVVDEAPTAPNVKMQTWESFVALAPHLPPQFFSPQFLLPLLQYSPFPSALVQEWTKAAMQAGKDPMHQAMQKAGLAEAQGKARKENAAADLDLAKARHEGQTDPLELQSKLMDQQTERIKAGAEIEAAHAKTAQTHLDMRKAVLDHKLDTHAALRDAALAEHQATLAAKTPPGNNQ